MSAPKKIRYHLNIRAALILAAIGLSGTLGLYVLWGYQERRILELGLEQVKAFQKAADEADKRDDQDQRSRNDDLALRHLTQYLDARPDDPEALDIDAELLLEAKNLPGAASVYEHLIRVELAPKSSAARRDTPTDRERPRVSTERVQTARRRLAEIYIAISDYHRNSPLAKIMAEAVGLNDRYHVAELHAKNLLGLDEDAPSQPFSKDANAHLLYALALEGQIVPGQTSRDRVAFVGVQGENEKENEGWAVSVEDGAILEYENVLALDAPVFKDKKAFEGMSEKDRNERTRVDIVAAVHLAGLYQKASRKTPEIRDELKKLIVNHNLIETHLEANRPDDANPKSKNSAVDLETFVSFLKAHPTARRLAQLYQKSQGFDLRLMSGVNDVSGLPKTSDSARSAGKSLVILADVNQVLHFRMFDGDGKIVVDTNEKRLTKQAQKIEELRTQLERLWARDKLTENEKSRIISAFTSIVGDTWKNIAIAKEVIDRLLEVPDSVEVRIARYTFFNSIGDPQKATAELEQAILLDPDNLMLILMATENAMRSASVGTFEPQFWLDQVPESSRNDPRVLTVQGMVEYTEQKYEDALATWGKGLDANRSDIGLTQRVALILLELRRDKDAALMITRYGELVKDGKSDPVLQFLEGIQHEHAGRFSPAIESLELARGRLPEGLQSHLHLILARCQEKQGDIIGAAKSYRTALEFDPKSLVLRQFLGRLLLATQPEEAAREFEQGLKSSPDQPALLVSLLEARLQQQRALPQGQRNWTDFDAVHKHAETVMPSSIALALLKAERQAADARVGVDKAISDLQEEVKKNPKSPELAGRLAEYYRSQGRMKEALGVLTKASDRNAAGDRGSLRVQRAMALISQGQGSEARSVLLEDVKQLAPADRDEVWTLLILLCKSQGNPETTRAIYNEWGRLLPDDPRPKFALLEMDIDANDQKAIHDRLDELRPHNAMYRLGQARLQLMKAKKLPAEKDPKDLLKGFDLQLMSPMNDESGLPTTSGPTRSAGRSLIILAVVDQVLHFRMFGSDRKIVVDTNEKRLTGRPRQIEELRRQLESLWPPHKLTDDEKVRVIGASTQIVRRTLLKEADDLVESVLREFKIDAVALLLKGQILEAEDATEKAADSYNEAWARGNVDALDRLVDLWARLRRRPELERLRQNDKTRQLDQIEVMAYLRHGAKGDAARIARESLAENPGRPSWQVGVLDYLGKNEEAETSLRTPAEQHPDKIEPWLALLRFYAIQHRPHTAGDSDRRHKVEEILEEIKPLLKDRWSDELLEAECRFAAADWPAADKAFDSAALKRDPVPREVQEAKARYHQDLDAADACLSRLKAEANIAKFKPLLKAGWPNELLAAECHIAAADWHGAKQVFDEAHKRSPQPPELLAAEERYRAEKGRPEAAEAALRRLEAEAAIAVEIKPHLKNRWSDALLAAECRFAAADWPAADKAFDEALKKYPEAPEVRAAATRYQAQKGRPNAAEACLRRLKVEATIAEAKQRVKLLSPELIEAECRRAAADFLGADQAFDEAVKRDPDDHDVQWAAARYYEERGRLDVAEACLRRMLKRKPDERGVVRKLAIVLSGQADRPGAWEQAQKLLGPEDSNTNTPEERLARAIVFGRSRDLLRVEQAIDLLRALLADVPAESSVAFTARDMLTRFLLAAGQADQASKVALTSVTSRTTTPGAVALYTEALLQSRQFDAAEEQRRRLEQMDPENPFLANLRARIIQGRSTPTDAAAALEKAYLDLAQETNAHAEQFGREAFRLILGLGPNAQGVAEKLATSLAKQNPALSWMLASILASQGKRVDALDYCRTAVDAGKNPTDLHEVGRVAMEVGIASRDETPTLNQVSEILEAALQRVPEADDLLVMKAMIDHFRSHFEEEKRLYRIVLSRKPQSPLALNNLAWVLSEGLHQPKEALEKIDEVIQLTGRNSNNVDTRGVILVRLGRFEEALDELKWVVQAEPTGVHYFHLAQAYRKMGRDADFRKAFEEAKRAGLTAAELDPAERADFEDMLKH